MGIIKNNSRYKTLLKLIVFKFVVTAVVLVLNTYLITLIWVKYKLLGELYFVYFAFFYTVYSLPLQLEPISIGINIFYQLFPLNNSLTVQNDVYRKTKNIISFSRVHIAHTQLPSHVFKYPWMIPFLL